MNTPTELKRLLNLLDIEYVQIRTKKGTDAFLVRLHDNIAIVVYAGKNKTVQLSNGSLYQFFNQLHKNVHTSNQLNVVEYQYHVGGTLPDIYIVYL